MEIALNSETPGGFKNENAITSQNGLALLASITLKNALNINNSNNNNCTTKNKNSITKNNNNNNNVDLTLNYNNKNNIKHNAPQPQHCFISSPNIASASLLSTAAASSSSILNTVLSQEQKNVFTFTTAGLQALTPTAISTIQTDAGVVAIDQQQQQQQNVKQIQLLQAELSTDNKNTNNHHTSLSTNHHQTNKTLSAKDPTVALLEALSIKSSKKKPNASKQQQQTSNANPTTVTVTTHLTGGSGGNNSSNNNCNGNGNGNSNKSSFRIPSDILDDLASRFIINVPDMELSNLIRICFQIELAHWFYLDFFCVSEEEKKLQPCGIKQFAVQLFEHIPFLRQHLSSMDKILEDWKNYKLSVPTYGAILISEDLNYCLLVQSYFAKSSWGFPKGKINENEDPVHCATREVFEETGYDITELILPNDFIEAVINYQYTRLYIVRDVSLDTKFAPRTRNEIKCCDWFPIDSLPVNKNDAISKPKLGRNVNSFFMIMPFVKRLKKWVNDKRNGVETRRKYSSGGSPASTSPLTIPNVMNGQMKSSSKKQQKRNANNSNDDANALKIGGGAAIAASTNFHCGNNTNTNVNCSNSNSNRSKRQRHKSMGDLDGIKINNSNNKINCKSTNNNISNNNCTSTTTTLSTATTTANSGGIISCNNINANINNNNNQKRHSKIVAAGGNVSNNINSNNTNNGCNNTGNNNTNNGNNISSKRQLFQSQSQTNNLQQNNEKIVSSFDLIRKEKQQMKAALAKAQKQHQNLNNNNNGRQRAKSQSDKTCVQSQQQQQQQQKSTGNDNNNKPQQRMQKQQSLIVTNSNMQNYNMSNNHQNNVNNSKSNKNHNNDNNNLNAKSNVYSSFNNKMTKGVYKTPRTPPLCGNDLLAVAVAAAAATPVVQSTTELTRTITTATQQVSMSGICDQLAPRPSSVSLHFPEAISPIKTHSIGNQMSQYKRMASATNLRILKRSTSHQSTQQNDQQPKPPQRQASALQFTPSFNSWTNFTFTKNFIANVFC